MEQILKKYTDRQIEKARKVKALIFDVDGVLTDGRIIYTNSGDEIKAFNVKDGQIIKFLKENQIIVGAITGRSSQLVARRCDELQLDFYFLGADSKLDKLQQIKQKFQLNDEEIAYVGDDIIDLAIIRSVGLGVAPSDALQYVQKEASLVTEAKGGEGVVREVADFILSAKGLLDDILKRL